jgi:hypothetical protein
MSLAVARFAALAVSTALMALARRLPISAFVGILAVGSRSTLPFLLMMCAGHDEPPF